MLSVWLVIICKICCDSSVRNYLDLSERLLHFGEYIYQFYNNLQCQKFTISTICHANNLQCRQCVTSIIWRIDNLTCQHFDMLCRQFDMPTIWHSDNLTWRQSLWKKWLVKKCTCRLILCRHNVFNFPCRQINCRHFECRYFHHHHKDRVRINIFLLVVVYHDKANFIWMKEEKQKMFGSSSRGEGKEGKLGRGPD